MVFDIFSIGDSAFLAAVLNAVAMIAGTGHYATAAGVGALLGILMTLVRGLTQYDGRGIRYQDMLVSILIYLLMFAPGVRVMVEDAYTGQVRVVDNVPLGPAAAGSILSNIGYRLTRLFEQGFSTPSMTGHGFADSLQVMASVRKNLLSRVQLGKANAPNAGGDLENSLINYVKECTLTGVDLNIVPIDSIMRQPQLLNAIRFDSNIYTTEIYTGGAPKILECTDAWVALDSYVRNMAVPEVENILKGALKVTSPADVEPRIDEALNALTGGSVSATDYMLSALITPMFEKGIVGRHEDGMREQGGDGRTGDPATQQPMGRGANIVHPHRQADDDMDRGFQLRDNTLDGLRRYAGGAGHPDHRAVFPDAVVDTAMDADLGRGEPVHHDGSGRQNGGVKRGPVQLALDVRAVPDGHGNPGMRLSILFDGQFSS